MHFTVFSWFYTFSLKKQKWFKSIEFKIVQLTDVKNETLLEDFNKNWIDKIDNINLQVSIKTINKVKIMILKMNLKWKYKLKKKKIKIKLY